jgi:hypothetical protein
MSTSDLEIVRETLRSLQDEAGEYTRTTERLGVTVEAHSERIEKIEGALHGEGVGKPGLETRVTLLERADAAREKADRKAAKAAQTTPAAGDSALERVETARAVASKTRWESIGKWAAIVALAAKAVYDALK